MRETDALLQVTHDAKHGLAYIYIAGRIEKGAAVKNVTVGDNIVLDFNAEGHLLGIELLSDKLLHPRLLAIAREVEVIEQ